jgi:hypothetical protein
MNPTLAVLGLRCSAQLNYDNFSMCMVGHCDLAGGAATRRVQRRTVDTDGADQSIAAEH